MLISVSGVRRSVALVAFVVIAVIVASTTYGDELYIGGTYGDNSHIYWFDTEGSTSSATPLVTNQAGYVRSVAVDAAQGRIYWGNDPVILSSYVGSSDLDGGNVSTVGVAGDIFSMAFHPVDSQVYYGSVVTYGGSTTRPLIRMDPDGSNPQEIAFASSGAIYALALDLSAGKVYWADGHSGIRRCNLDGLMAEDVITGLAGIYDLALDESRGLIYWSAPNKVLRAPVDGSTAPEEILTGVTAAALALSPDGDTVYYSDSVSSVYRMNSDGSDPTFVTSVYKPVAIAVVPEPATLALLGLGGLALLRRKRK